MADRAGSLDDDELLTGEAVSLTVRPTPFVLRATGALIDAVATIILFVALQLLLTVPAIAGSLNGATEQIAMIATLVFALVIVPITVETASGGRSLGRLIVGARIVRVDGGAAGFRHALIRALLGVLEIYMTVGGLAAAVGLFSRRGARLGDLVAGTYSVHERLPRWSPAPPTIPQELASWAEIADVARMPDPLARRVAAFLRHSPGLSSTARQRQAAALAAEVAPHVSPLPSVPAETLLAGVSAVRRRREARGHDRAAARRRALASTLHERPHGFPER